MKNDDKKTVMEAAALTYSVGGGAPVITALGRGLVAEKILEKAREANVPIVSDALLAHAMQQMNVGDEIPREFYAIVAQILVTISKMDREYGEKVRLVNAR